MKKQFALLITMVLVVLLAGCVRRQPPVDSETTAPATESGEEKNENYDRSDLKKNMISDGVYSVALPFTLTWNSQIIVSGNTAIFSGTSESGLEGLFFYDMATGGYDTNLTVGTGNLYLFDDGAFGLLSNNGNVYRFEPHSKEAVIIASDNDNFTYNFLSDGSMFHTLDTATVFYDKTGKELFKLKLSSVYDFSSVRYISDGYIYMTAGRYDSVADVLKVDITSGKYSAVGKNELGYDFCLSDNYVVTKVYGEDKMSVYKKSDALTKASFQIESCGKSETLLCATDEYIVTRYTLDNRSNVGIYGMDGKLLYFDCPADSTNDVLFSSFPDEKGLFLCYSNYTKNDISVFYIEISALSEIERPVIDKDSQGDFEDGITVLSGNDAVLSFRDFIAEPVTDSELCENAISIVNDTIAEFPEGFFDELLLGKSSVCRSLVICLTGNLKPLSGNMIAFPGGYSYSDGTVHYIAVDITFIDNLKSTLCHEIMHIIDRYMSETVFGDVYPEWNNYIPNGAYFDSYLDSNGMEINDFEYTANGYTNESDVWFATPYSRTFAIEDRAVLFSLMFTHNPYYNGFTHIKERMDYLAKVIRDNFESVQNAETVIWEY